MKPIGIFRHSPTEGPGYFATYLETRGIPWTLIKVDEGELVPSSPADYAGLVFMGGPMSVNDSLPWIDPVLSLIRMAVSAGVPSSVVRSCLENWGSIRVLQPAPKSRVSKTHSSSPQWRNLRLQIYPSLQNSIWLLTRLFLGSLKSLTNRRFKPFLMA